MNAIELIESAILAEQEAQRMYKEGAAQAEDAETRALFEQLAHWEIGHETMLRDRLATLKLIKDK